jgi:hypothetical protein
MCWPATISRTDRQRLERPNTRHLRLTSNAKVKRDVSTKPSASRTWEYPWVHWGMESKCPPYCLRILRKMPRWEYAPTAGNSEMNRTIRPDRFWREEFPRTAWHTLSTLWRRTALGSLAFWAEGLVPVASCFWIREEPLFLSHVNRDSSPRGEAFGILDSGKGRRLGVQPAVQTFIKETTGTRTRERGVCMARLVA